MIDLDKVIAALRVGDKCPQCGGKGYIMNDEFLDEDCKWSLGRFWCDNGKLRRSKP